MPKSTSFKSGFIAIVGAPNAGKSTLLNHLLGEKISITSKKPQTTRNRILGVLNRPMAQFIFIDTPGLHKAKELLNQKMVEQALAVFGDVDLILWVADADSPDPESEVFIFKQLAAQKKPILMALNKIDLLKNEQIHAAADAFRSKHDFADIVPISAKHGTGLDTLLTAMEARLPIGPPLNPEETLTDLPERFIAAEIIREKVFRLTGQEIPYATAVTVERFFEKEDGSLVHIDATIHLERDSQKGIVIGKGGGKLKQIGETARKDIERMIGSKVFLKLFVRIQKNWSKDTKALRKFGY